MAYNNRANNDRERAAVQAPAMQVDVPSTPIYLVLFSLLVRCLGLAILIVGLMIGYKAVTHAWLLYEEPREIEFFAEAIEEATQIDSIVSSALPPQTEQSASGQAASGQSASGQSGADGAETARKIRLSYFIAWIIAPLLLIIVGSLAMSAITTGGRLALYDLVGDRVARTIRRELRRAN